MGSDYSMNPPKPASYVTLFHTGETGIAVYRYPGEMDDGPRVWTRVYLIFGAYASECAAMLHTMGQRPRVISDTIAFEDIIDPDTMRELINPKPPTYEPKHA